MAEEASVAEATISDDTQLDELREGIDDPQVLKAQLAREAEARRQLTARAKKAEEQAKTEREARIRLEEASSQNTTKTEDTPKGEDERLELRLDGYSKEEVNYIMANGGRKSLEDKNSYTAIAIAARREQLKAERAASDTQGKSGEDQFREANFNLPKNPSLQDYKKSIADMEKVLPRVD